MPALYRKRLGCGLQPEEMGMEETRKNRGFASMDAEKQREIARKGGRAAHEKGTAHEFSSEEARQAGRKGGERVSSNRAHMAEIGRLGGRSSAGRRQPAGAAPSVEQPGEQAGFSSGATVVGGARDER